ncbi:D-glucuronyl C5-epimerase family protein [Guyparkeria halophila]|uniref:D-glucuronyl C5-epimerase family protein n=1 Tax=Guyparkeria halophila TaxID=47960 RepID=A0ABZ0Z1Y2_9GAMM|nr:D-glucuronyl C5-epimerase family protein [Guyparkeria halophila]WQH17375.1 D-glucuronyl C5-epimerase family protein [Guyparkeria halophila]
MIKFVVFLIFILALVGSDFWLHDKLSNFPNYFGWRELAKTANAEYRELGVDVKDFESGYSYNGPYMDYGNGRYFKESKGRIRLDKSGIPEVRYGEEFHYNPVTTAQFALAEYSRPGGVSSKFLDIVDSLVSRQDANGAFRYNFVFRKYAHEEDYEPGWTSAMAQGQALSALARAYALTEDEKYLESGELAFNYLTTPFDEGGVKTDLGELRSSWSGDVFFMEYPADPPVYTLNGYMFVIIGLYDWNEAIGRSDATRRVLEDSLLSFRKILGFYDLGAFSSYDLSFMTLPFKKSGEKRSPHYSPYYHAVHIEQLNLLYDIFGEQYMRETAERWAEYVR